MKYFFLVLVGGFSFLSLALDTSCFESVSNIDAVKSGEIIRIVWPSADILPIQGWNILALKEIFTVSPKEFFDYTISTSSGLDTTNKTFLSDNNPNTALEFIKSPKSITLKFESILQPNTFNLLFDADEFDSMDVEISNDNITFTSILLSEIQGFSFLYIRFSFIDQRKNSKKSIFSPTILRDILFIENSQHTWLVKNISWDPVKIYANSRCPWEDISQELAAAHALSSKTQFITDKDTKTFPLNFISNPAYNNDRDGDSIINQQDNCTTVKNPDQKDTDKDLIGDACDIDPNNRNPYLGDMDRDGVDDARDNCFALQNPNQRDSNSDGRGDACSDDDGDGILGNKDNCPTVANPDQKDVNVNGVGDICESDRDNDGLFDSVDNCPLISNPDQKDSDSDGIGDVCDNCARYNPDQRDEDNDEVGDVCAEWENYQKSHDDDNDGVINWGDNCPKIPNPKIMVVNQKTNITELLQSDFDQDNIGDACDNCQNVQNSDQKDDNKNGTGDMCEDIDGDGVVWYQDNCPLDANPDQADKNRDGAGDMCDDTDNDSIRASQDNCPYAYNPDQMDSDNDKRWNVCDTKDDRYLESNKTVFIAIFSLIGLSLLIGIFLLGKKMLHKNI